MRHPPGVREQDAPEDRRKDQDRDRGMGQARGRGMVPDRGLDQGDPELARSPAQAPAVQALEPAMDRGDRVLPLEAESGACADSNDLGRNSSCPA